MAWVITRLCVDCKDTECVKACPVDCIYELTVTDERYPNQLYIHPEECINCAACEPACPWGAIFEESAVPDIFQSDIALNAQIFQDHQTEDFTTEPHPLRKNPTSDEVEANKKKHGYA